MCVLFEPITWRGDALTKPISESAVENCPYLVMCVQFPVLVSVGFESIWRKSVLLVESLRRERDGDEESSLNPLH